MPIQRRNQELIDLLRTPMTQGARDAGGGGHEIQDEGVALPQQGALDFQGAGVTASDDAVNGKTLVTIPGVTEGPGIDLVGQQVGLGGDAVLLYHADGSPVSEYATITLALAAVAAGDIVQPQAKTYVEDLVIPAGAIVRGRGRGTVVQGTVTGGDGARLEHVRVEVDGDDAGMLYAVSAGADGETFTLEDCEVLVDNATGDACALYSGAAGVLVARRCLLRGVSAAADGWAAYRGAAGGAGELDHCVLEYTTAPVEEAT